MNKKEKQFENDEIFKKNVKYYMEWCAEIDEMTKPFRIEYKDREVYQSYSKTCDECGHGYVTMYKSNHMASPEHMKAVIKENKYMLDWRIYKSENKLNSKD